LPAVQELTGLARATIYKAVVQRNFPKPVKLGRASAWPEAEVRAWIEARKAERSAA
jgi:predicted DNA-binding transcriptional regulator AlpA